MGSENGLEEEYPNINRMPAQAATKLAEETPEEPSTSGRFEETPVFTVAEAIDAIGFGKFQVGLLFYAGSAWLSDAMEMMILSLLGPAVACQWSLSPDKEGSISTVVFVGTLLGANAWGAVADAFGRRAGFFATAIFAFIFGLGSAFAPNFQALLALRFFVGVGLGGAHVPITLYMEYVPTKFRGIMLVALQSFWTLGTMIEAGLGWAMLTRLGWRWLLAVSSIPLLCLALLYPILPESPYWLAATGRTQEALTALQNVARINNTAMPAGTLRHSLSPQEGKAGPSWRELINKGLGSLRHSMSLIFKSALGITTGLLMFIWFVNALTYYGEVLLTTTIHTTGQSHCGSDHKLRLSSQEMSEVFITTLAELPGLIVAALLIDLIGRKKTMLLAMITITVSTVSLMISEAHSLVKLFAARAASMGGFTTLFIVTPELYPTRVRSFALGLNNSMSRFGAIVSPFVSVGLTKGGHLRAAEGVIAGFCTAAAVCICCLPREKASRSLEEDDNVELQGNGNLEAQQPNSASEANGATNEGLLAPSGALSAQI